ncbi:MAG: restriction endonuclease subunit S [Clostridium perfringens]|nr:restriction endonuclease subunit S [Clostridium perfringens]MDU3376329.1 restriction endonuclease subunit S [Clostridium perfringens]MDU3534492.1 restriction endonuclease subunit S [Clostridium perfringens]HBI6974790.1 restriction endonuclease subunit S [Clostridium perfringens]
MKFKLGDLCEFQKGYAFKSKDFVDNGEYIVKVTNLTNDSVEFMNCVKISYEKAEEYKKYELNNKDIIITTVGSWPNNPNSIVGKVVRVPNIKKKAFLNQNAVRVRGVNINQDFLYYLLRDKKFSGYLIGTAQGSASQASINQKDIKDYTVDIPDNNEQKAIAKILSDLDEKIEVNNKINKNLEEMAQAIFKQWFVDFEFPNEEGKPYKSSGGEMVESELGMIPKGFKVKEFGDIINITSGKRPKNKSKEYNKETNIPLIGASSVMGFTNDFNFDTNILVIGRVGTHGVVQRFNYKVWASDNTLVIKSNCLEFSNQILKSIDYKSLNRGSTQPLITQGDIKQQKIIFPNVDLLKDFEKRCFKLMNLFENNVLENERLEKLRDTLLPKLMSGEIRVPLENSEN